MDDPGTRFAAAVQLHRQGRVAEAETAYRALLEMVPGHPEVVHLLGVALLHLRRATEAGPLLQAAVAADPLRSDYHINLANFLHCTGDERAALAGFRTAIALEPGIAEAWFNVAHTARRQGRTDDAINGYRRGLAIFPNDASAQASLGGTLYEGGHGRAAVTAYRRSLALHREPIANSGYLYVLEFDDSVPIATHQLERRRWAWAHLPYRSVRAPMSVDRDPERLISIAFFAPGFDNANAWLLEPFLQRRNPHRFRTILYSNQPPDGETSLRFSGLADLWRTIETLDDDGFDAIIRADKVDILVDTANHVGGHRLSVFVGRPAPIQISGWSHGTGTGMSVFDYVISDRATLPTETRHLFAEKVLDVPCRVGFPPPAASPEVSPPSSGDGRPFTFGHLGRLSKVTEETIVLWRQILKAAPETRLLLKADLQSSASGFRRVMGQLSDGVDRDRIVVIGPKDRFANMADYASIDLALDTTPVAGPMTVWESLWMGVPAVVLRHTTQSAGGVMSILNAVGLSDFIAEDEDAYVDIVLRCVRAPERLAAMRDLLRDRVASSPAGNVETNAAAMADVFRTAWRNWCQAG